MSQKLVLFDLPSRDKCACWSLNPWKTRAALNFKGIDYTTEWTEYPDLAPKLKDLGVQPNTDSSMAAYTSPTVRLPDGTYMSDSRKIIEALETLQPEPSLHLDSGYIDRVQAAVFESRQPIDPILMPRVPELLLPPRSAEYFSTTRAQTFGMPLPELAKSDRAGESAWKATVPGFEKLKVILHEHEDGPFVLGKVPSYADLILAGYWKFLEKLDKGDVIERVLDFDEAFRMQYEACGKWLERDDH